MERINTFFEKLKNFSFWERLFSWRLIKDFSDSTLNEIKGIELRVSMLEKQLLDETSKNKVLTSEINSLEKQVLIQEKSLMKEYQREVAQVSQVKKDLDAERCRILDSKLKEKEDEFEKLKIQWSSHETFVEQKIKMLCQTHLVDYVEEVPFKGKPDNTINICGEYIVFDAKSPANDDLTNFPKYIKRETDNLKKYASQESVRKEIFLVVPSNTIGHISQLTYNLGDYKVYVITIDSLEPIILSLKKIEEYEFAEQLSPEERENICRVIGRFAHTTKRKIQIDQFFANQFIELLVKCKNDLPKDLLESVIEFEKAEKLNPPSERRSKQILTNELKSKNESINAEAQVRKISIPESFEDVKNLE